MEVRGSGGGGMEWPVIRTGFFFDGRPLMGALWMWAEEAQPLVMRYRRDPHFAPPAVWYYSPA